MPPPFRPLGSSPWTVDKEPLSRRHSGFDESLRLPPLQSSIPPSPSETSVSEGRHVGIPSTKLNVSPTRDQHSRSLDAKTASMEPSLNQKLEILSIVSDPLPCAGHHGTLYDKRGAFIAVEGANPAVLDQVGRSLEKVLVAGGDVTLKVWTNDESGESDTPGSGVRKGKGVDAGPAAEVEGGSCKDDLLSSYFQTILSWRRKSQQIAYHVTGGDIGGNFHKGIQDKNSKVAQASSTEPCTPPRDNKSPAAAPKIPVALVKGGLSLTLSDKYASAMPISDRYTPADHWQWLASLWRGTANPDLVVHVQESNDGPDDTTGTVDVSKRMGLMVIRLPKDRGLDEATERRMGFEIMEWMRDGPFRDEVPARWRQDSF